MDTSTTCECLQTGLDVSFPFYRDLSLFGYPFWTSVSCHKGFPHYETAIRPIPLRIKAQSFYRGFYPILLPENEKNRRTRESNMWPHAFQASVLTARPPTERSTVFETSSEVVFSQCLVASSRFPMPCSPLGGRCNGQKLVMCSAVCWEWPQSHAGDSLSPHSFMVEAKRPTRLLRRLRVVHCLRGDISNKRVSEVDSSSKVLPSKILKYGDRSSDPHEIHPGRGYDHSLKKTFNDAPPAYDTYTSDLFSPSNPLHHSSNHLTCLTSAPPAHFLHSYPPHSRGTHPLNLTVDDNTHNVRLNANTTSQKRFLPPWYPPGTRYADITDPIEEHFRRSLGNDYPECISNKSSRSISPSSPHSPLSTRFTYVNALTSSLNEQPYSKSPSPISSTSQNEPLVYNGDMTQTVSTTTPYSSHPIHPTGRYQAGKQSPPVILTDLDMVKKTKKPPQKITVNANESVDDHFAKSLGDQMWTQLQVKNSVDDHFHKALGDTWLRIKAEKETANERHLIPPIVMT